MINSIFIGTRLEALEALNRYTNIELIVTKKGSWVYNQYNNSEINIQLIDKTNKSEIFNLLSKIETRLILSEFTIRESLQKLMFSFLIGAFTISNCCNYLEFQRDSFKQLSLIANFKNNSIIKNNSSFLFDDQTYALNAIDRWYRFYEYSGLMKLAFGDDNRFGENYKAFINFGGNNTIQDYANATTVPYYNLSNYKLVSPQYKVTIKQGKYKLSLLGILRTLIYKWFNNDKFHSRIEDIVSLEFQKL